LGAYNRKMVNPPPPEVLKEFDVRVVTPLGGRLNQHWLVESAGGAKLVLRRWASPLAEIEYEVRLVEAVGSLGWPVASTVAGPVEVMGHRWSLARMLPGQPADDSNDPAAAHRARGRLLAEFHGSTIALRGRGIGQRPGWRRCEQILADRSLDALLARCERQRPQEVAMVRYHLNRSRERAADLRLSDRPEIIIHGDFTRWNLLFEDGRLSGLLDFELAHQDHRVGDFALAWRGKYDGVIRGYHEVSPLEPVEWEMLTPLWWAFLIELACRHLASGTWDDGWIMTKLLERSALMGPDSVPYRA
jgi:aminoglycoside phosphotransferase (APT) family kinase protein